MAFTDHKISAFAHKISELADQPNMPPDELKARFDACPEQLRVSLNAVCDEAAALDGKVDNILTQTFEGAVDKSMLSPALITELDEKATQAALAEEAAAREAETAARESADSGLSTRISSLESSVPGKARVAYGTYTGNNADNRSISLGFRPYLVVIGCSIMAQLILPNLSVYLRKQGTILFGEAHLVSSGFQVSASECYPGEPYANLNNSSYTYHYIAIGK